MDIYLRDTFLVLFESTYVYFQHEKTSRKQFRAVWYGRLSEPPWNPDSEGGIRSKKRGIIFNLNLQKTDIVDVGSKKDMFKIFDVKFSPENVMPLARE